MKRLLVLLVAVAAAVALAGVYLPSSAATVGSATISRKSLDTQLRAIAASQDYTCFLSEERQLAGQGRVQLFGAGNEGTAGGSYGTTFVDDWLSSMITDHVLAGMVARDGVQVGAHDLALARSVLSRRITTVLRQYATVVGAPVPGCGGTGSAVLASMPGWFVAQATTAEADQAVLDARAAGVRLDASQIAAYFAGHRTTFDRDCLSIIVVKTQAAAQRAAQAIAGGTTFSKEASTVSLTTGTGVNGGAAGCGFLTGTFLAPELAALPVGAVTKPFSARGVWWLATITKRSTVPLSSVQGTVVTAILHAGQSRADAELRGELRRAHVTVDARYGTASGGATLILPPASPRAGDLLSGVADAPSSAAPAG